MLEYQLVENIAAELTSLAVRVAGRVMRSGISEYQYAAPPQCSNPKTKPCATPERLAPQP